MKRVGINLLFLLLIKSFCLLAIPTNPAKRPGSYPFISGDTFRKFCDHIIDETSMSFHPEGVKKGDTIFVCANYLEKFFSQDHPKIKNAYIMVTHNSDHSVPGNYARYLEDPKVFAWFGQNTDCYHQKLHPIPIGLANPHYGHGNVKLFKKALDKIKPIESRQTSKSVYVNFNINNYKKTREPAWNHLSKQSFALCVPPNRTYPAYLREMGKHRFVASPRGNGIDCHRTWEALLLGCIPIVDATTISQVYEDLPVIQINDWRTISSEFLEKKVAEFKSQPMKLEKLSADYWFNLINSYQKSCRANSL